MGRRESCVLVVSTDLEILRALSQALTLNGYAVATAMDWSEAMARPHRLPVSALLYDVKELDWREWQRLVDLRKAHAELAVVLLSSLESRELDRAVSEGLIAAYQVKPIRLLGLEECLEMIGAEG